VFLSTDITYTIISLGCSKNLVDSERINGSMNDAGFRHAESSDDADIILINTCGFINPAKEESIEVIFDAIEGIQDNGKRLYNRRNKFLRRVVVFGCLSQRYDADLKKDIPEIDFLYGLPDENFVPGICKAFDITTDKIEHASRVPIVDGLSYAYIKIAEGCSNNCSYCAIPLIRGPHNSYPPDLVMADARAAASRGVRELIIIAQDITSYQYEGYDLVKLVNEVSALASIEWVRLLYLHPDHVNDDIITMIKNNEKIVKYIDLPFQHVSAHILRGMGRKGDAGTYLNLIGKLRDALPNIRIRSTFMVGFPGETEDDFRELLEFLKEAKLDKVGAFQYSPEENTPAEAFKGMVQDSVKEKRFEKLMELQKKISRQKLSEMIGNDVRVIVEEQVDDVTYIGRSEYDAPEVDGIFYLTGENIVLNTIVRARIIDAVEYDLIGERL
jgi:ribosomal protein S12 methylthiotransferase